MLRDFQTMYHSAITVEQVLAGLTIAFLSGLIIANAYRLSYKGPGYPLTFLTTLVALSMITAIVIMLIGNNLARAFGLVGAMSIIRFRTSLKDTLDIVFVSFSLAIGMAVGSGLYAVALAGALFISAALLLLAKKSVVSTQKREFLLQFTCSANGNSGDIPYLPVLSKYCKRNKIINTKAIGDGTLELSYYVDLENPKKNNEFVRELRYADGVKQVNLFYDEEDF